MKLKILISPVNVQNSHLLKLVQYFVCEIYDLVQRLILLAPTGALVLMMVYYIYIYISGHFWGYFEDILGISLGYFGDILKIF